MTVIEKDLYKPSGVGLEASTLCQLNCARCFMRHREHTLGLGYLKYDNFIKFVEKNDCIKTIELSNSGEIFLNPDLLKIMKYAHEKNIELTAYNGVNLNNVKEEVLEGLVKHEFRLINCAIDGASQETYEIYRVCGDFNKVISNIRKINEYKKKYNSIYPKLKYQFIVFGHNECDIIKAKELAVELDMEMDFRVAWHKDYSPIKNPEFVKKETNLNYLESQEFLNKETEKNYLKSICTLLWRKPQINWDGRLLGCCILYNKDFGVNVFEVGLENALKSEKITYAKQMLMNKVPARDDVPCTDCFYYKNMQKNDSWFLESDFV